MKLFKNRAIIILLCIINSLFIGKERTAQQSKPKIIQTQSVAPLIQQKKPGAFTSYAQARFHIQHIQPSTRVIRNNTFTPEFVNFVKSLNFNPLATKALFEAGISFHAPFTVNNQNNRNILTTLNNTIQTIMQSIPLIERPTTPIAPIQPPMAPMIPTPSPTPPVAQPIKPIEPMRPTPQPIQPIPPKEPMRPSLPRKQPTPMRPAPRMQPKAPTPITKKPAIKPTVPSIPLPKDYTITNNLAMFLDPKGDESLQKRADLAAQAIILLFQKAAPVIMTSNLLEIILSLKQQPRIIPGTHDITLNILRSIDLASINYYFHNSDNLILLIPKQYIQTNISNANSLNLNDQAAACGFNPGVLNAISDTNTLMQEVQRQQSKYTDPTTFITHLTQMFMPQKKDGELIAPERDNKWLIYLIGHGSHAFLQIGFARKQLEELRKINAIAQGKVPGVRLSPGSKVDVRQNQSKIKEYEIMTQGRKSWPDSQIVPESAQIAGIPANSFSQLMEFFDKNLDVAYVHYTTCFSGGINQAFVNETLSALDVNFIVSTEGLHEAVVNAGLNFDPYSGKINHPSFTEFFKLLRMFFTQPEQYVQLKAKKADPIVKILHTISTESAKQKPFVRFPGTEFFTVARSKQTLILTNTKVRAQEIEKKTIDATNPNLEAVIISTPRINVPINLGKKRPMRQISSNQREEGHIALAFPSPKELKPNYEALYILQEINYQDTLQAFIFNCLHLNARLYPQTLIIKTLKGIAYQQSGLPNTPQPITNLMIHMEGVSIVGAQGYSYPSVQSSFLVGEKLGSGMVGLNVRIIFEYNGAIYQSSFAIKHFQNMDDIYRNLQQVRFSVTPKQSIDMNAVARDLISTKDIAQLKKPITLDTIVDYFDDKINKQDPSMAIQSEADIEALSQFVKRQKQK